ncbi:hypothetical protein GJ496_009637, partial [Pomphorhynchus laevis]
MNTKDNNSRHIQCSIFVSRLPKNCTRDQLASTFEHFGPISKIALNEKKPVYTIIQFDDESSVTKVFREEPIFLHDTKWRLIVKRRVRKDPLYDYKANYPEFASKREELVQNHLHFALSKSIEIGSSTLGDQATSLYRHLFEKPASRVVLETKILDFVTTALKNQTQFEECEFKLFGSSLTGLSHPYSDIDFTILFPDGSIAQRCTNSVNSKESCNTVEKYCDNEFQSTIMSRAIALICNARVPFIRIFCPCSFIHFDITIDNRAAVANSKLIERILEWDQNIAITFAILYVVLYDRHECNFNSYTVFWLVIFYFQQKLEFPPISDIISSSGLFESATLKESNLESKIKGLFNFYSSLDFESSQLNLNNGQLEQRDNHLE